MAKLTSKAGAHRLVVGLRSPASIPLFGRSLPVWIEGGVEAEAFFYLYGVMALCRRVLCFLEGATTVAAVHDWRHTCRRRPPGAAER